MERSPGQRDVPVVSIFILLVCFLELIVVLLIR